MYLSALHISSLIRSVQVFCPFLNRLFLLLLLSFKSSSYILNSSLLQIFFLQIFSPNWCLSSHSLDIFNFHNHKNATTFLYDSLCLHILRVSLRQASTSGISGMRVCLSSTLPGIAKLFSNGFQTLASSYNYQQ